jgi:hypothetical protein
MSRYQAIREQTHSILRHVLLSSLREIRENRRLLPETSSRIRTGIYWAVAFLLSVLDWALGALHGCKILLRKIGQSILNPLGASLLVLLSMSALVVFVTFELGYYNAQFLPNVLAEAHGLLLELLVLGVLLLWLNKRGEDKFRVESYKQQIDDFRGWRSDEAAYRIVGNIKRLNELGISAIDLHDCYFGNISLANINLRGANLGNVNFREVRFWRTCLAEASLRGADISTLNFRNRDEVDLTDAIYDYETKFPEPSFSDDADYGQVRSRYAEQAGMVEDLWAEEPPKYASL